MENNHMIFRCDTGEQYIHSEKDLVELLQRITTREHSFFMLLLNESNYLSIGLSKDFAFVQSTGETKNAPHLCATYKYTSISSEQEDSVIDASFSQAEVSDELVLFDDWEQIGRSSRVKKTQLRKKYIEFQVGGTQTPVSAELCISRKDMIEILLYYFRYHKLYEQYKWIPV